MRTRWRPAASPENEGAKSITGMSSIAREAGALLMEHFRQAVKIEYKGEVDLVTVADRKSEALILARIRDQALELLSLRRLDG